MLEHSRGFFMTLTLERLVRFDLVEQLEESLPVERGMSVFMEFLQTVQEIQSVDQFIKDSPSFPGTTEKIIRGEMVAAIGATLAIEDKNLSYDEIEATFQKATVSEQLARREQEAENSRKVYAFILDVVSKCEGEFQYSEALIKQIHKYFTDNLNYLSNVPGQYRGNFTPTFGVPRRQSLCQTSAEVETAMPSLVAWLNRPGAGLLSSYPVVKAVMAHYYLAEIHPFGDGNGRTARALEALVLSVTGMNNYCFWSLANFWSIHRDQYIFQLGNIRATCDPWDFLLWGIKGYLDEIKRIKGVVLKKLKQLMFLDYLKYLLAAKKGKDVKISQRVVDFMQLLIAAGRTPLDKFMASGPIAALYGSVSAPTRSRDFKKMQQLELLKMTQEDGRVCIEPNFAILEALRYHV